MAALDALATDQSSRALGCAQGARYSCPEAAASSLEQIVCSKVGSFTHPKDVPVVESRCLQAMRLRPGPRLGRLALPTTMRAGSLTASRVNSGRVYGMHEFTVENADGARSERWVRTRE